jgi:excisionase family DNA binding protein
MNIGNASSPVPFRERLTCTIAEACSATGIGRCTIYQLINDGVIKTKKVRARRMVDVRSLIAAFEPRDEAAAA